MSQFHRIFAGALTLTLFITLSCSAQSPNYTVVEAFPNLSLGQVTDIQNAGDGTNRLFVCEKSGRIHVFPNNPEVATAEIYLDLTSVVIAPSEMGLLGLAFHPDYAENGYFYVNYNARSGGSNVTRISRFSVDDANGDRADKNSEVILMEFVQPFPNHDGGQIAFGPDGYLYIATGDGGSGSDPLNAGQDLRTLLGKILRIDVDSPDAGMAYGIPDSNPFAGNSHYMQEIYAWGLRNPWRFSFDSETGELWCADVGQNLWEEINIIEKGGNYGWRIMEGFHCFNPNNAGDRNFDCDSVSLISPVWEYSHDNGDVSITGGYVYRGSRLPDLQGAYIYADFVTGRIWGLNHTPDATSNRLIYDSPLNVSTFGLDEAGEIYVGGFDGKIYEIQETSGVDRDDDEVGSAFLESITPNPGHSGSTSLRYRVEQAGTIAITIVNAVGEDVLHPVAGRHAVGDYVTRINTTDLPDGNYFVRLIAEGREEVRGMTIFN